MLENATLPTAPLCCLSGSLRYQCGQCGQEAEESALPEVPEVSRPPRAGDPTFQQFRVTLTVSGHYLTGTDCAYQTQSLPLECHTVHTVSPGSQRRTVSFFRCRTNTETPAHSCPYFSILLFTHDYFLASISFFYMYFGGLP